MRAVVAFQGLLTVLLNHIETVGSRGREPDFEQMVSSLAYAPRSVLPTLVRSVDCGITCPTAAFNTFISSDAALVHTSLRSPLLPARNLASSLCCSFTCIGLIREATASSSMVATGEGSGM
eukprot:CAMPEP_0114265370 /NCGR_PEP_ID=MMETSP0058-20121206/23864_1 /TAXON_ID=36894 /ORGANISM="Pyramimonas parkeae, CCMP726" /LENGTH=120 /DNA_ID=CAMNT_0001382427 /DNA_START=643 /DNA_END=1006 /DNA_ORIENTATION=+